MKKKKKNNKLWKLTKKAYKTMKKHSFITGIFIGIALAGILSTL